MARRYVLLALAAVVFGTGVATLRSQPPVGEPESVVALPVVEETNEPDPEPTAEPTTEPTTEPPDPAEAESTPLTARLQGLVDDPALVAVPRLGVSVVDAGGQTVFDHHGNAVMLPASTQKLIVAAAALATLGPEHRYLTRVAVPVLPDADGVVDGDLFLVGGGDPALTTPLYGKRVVPERPRTALDRLADRIVQAGVRRVTGHVLGDPNIFPDEPAAPGWPERYFSSLDATLVSGLTVDAGRRVTQKGGRLVAEPSPNPAAEAAAALRRLLEERDVVIEQGSGWTREPTVTGHEIARVGSPPLGELLRYMVQRSDNHLAEAIYKSVGLAVLDDATFRGAGDAALRTLEPLGLNWAGAVLADGSGLSRENRLSARFLADLDARVTASPHGQQWQSLMAVSGSSGTLRRRLRDTVVEGRLHGKTGSLRDVRSLSGTVFGPEGRRYHFAVIGNGLDGKSQQLVRTLQDEVVLALAEDLYECVRLPIIPEETEAPATEQPPEEPDASEPEAYELVCAA